MLPQLFLTASRQLKPASSAASLCRDIFNKAPSDLFQSSTSQGVPLSGRLTSNLRLASSMNFGCVSKLRTPKLSTVVQNTLCSRDQIGTEKWLTFRPESGKKHQTTSKKHLLVCSKEGIVGDQAPDMKPWWSWGSTRRICYSLMTHDILNRFGLRQQNWGWPYPSHLMFIVGFVIVYCTQEVVIPTFFQPILLQGKVNPWQNATPMNHCFLLRIKHQQQAIQLSGGTEHLNGTTNRDYELVFFVAAMYCVISKVFCMSSLYGSGFLW